MDTKATKHKPATPLLINYERRPELDKRMSRGDDYAGDAWVRWVAVGHTPQREYAQLIFLAKNYLKLQKQYIEECGPCDHSVNICVCGLIADAEDTSEILRDLGELQ